MKISSKKKKNLPILRSWPNLIFPHNRFRHNNHVKKAIIITYVRYSSSKNTTKKAFIFKLKKKQK